MRSVSHPYPARSWPDASSVRTRRIAAIGCIVFGCSVSGASAALAAGDGNATSGATIYERCAACHALAWDRTGPRHCGLFGRRAGSVPGFTYSNALKRSGIVWNAQTLDRFLASPMTAVPGTSMGYAGVTDARERADLIAYLKQAGNSAACATK
jgi:cytochrome c